MSNAAQILCKDTLFLPNMQINAQKFAHVIYFLYLCTIFAQKTNKKQINNPNYKSKSYKSMKKIVTLFVMLSLVLGMNAGNLQARTGHKASQVELKSIKPALSMEQVQAMKARHDAKLAMPQQAVRRAPMPKKESFDYEIQGVAFVNELMDYYGIFTISMYMIAGSNEEVAFSCEMMSYEGVIPETGTFTLADCDTVTLDINDAGIVTPIEIADMTLEIEKDPDGNYIGVAMITDADGNEFTINLYYIIPDAKETVAHTFEEPVMGRYYASNGGFYVLADDGEYAFQMLLNSTTLEGTFDESVLNAQYTVLAKINGSDTTWLMEPYSVDITGVKNASEDSINLAVSYFAEDTILYNLSMVYAVPQLSNETISITCAANETEVDDSYLDYYGDLTIYGQNAANQLVSFDFYPADGLTGSYPADYLEVSYTYFGVVSGKDTTWYDLDRAAGFTIADAGSDTYTLTGSFVCMSESEPDKLVTVVLNMTFSYTAGASGMYAYDENTDVNKTFTEGVDNVAWDYSYASAYGVTYLEIMGTDNTYLLLEFNSTANPMTDGMYQIALGNTANTVTASLGYEEDPYYGGYMYPSYYATISGQYIQKVWFIVSGTVTVNGSQVIVDAQNSLGKNIDITINFSGSDLRDIVSGKKEAKGVKVLNRGMINVLHNDRRFNLQGAEL